jgi:hypothetical protein
MSYLRLPYIDYSLKSHNRISVPELLLLYECMYIDVSGCYIAILFTRDCFDISYSIAVLRTTTVSNRQPLELDFFRLFSRRRKMSISKHDGTATTLPMPAHITLPMPAHISDP